MAGLAAVLPLVVTPGLAVVMAVLLGAALGLVMNGLFPFVFSQVSPRYNGLGMGVYLSGSAIAAALLTGHLIQIQVFHPAVGSLLAAGSFLLCGFFVASAPHPASSSPLGHPTTMKKGST